MQIYVYVPSEKFSTLKYTGETLLYTGLYIYFSTQSTEEDLELIPPLPSPSRQRKHMAYILLMK